ncbi:MAG TPA: methionine synthase, partial [Bryobacterales bacterium]|nr:methionine synthase [Bryobacterales bacterium]
LMNQNDRSRLIREALNERIIVLDGAMGTAIQQHDLTADDFGGPEYEGSNDHLVLTRPDVILDIHRSYLKAGCDVVETDSFNATAGDLKDFGLAAKAYEINFTAAKLARQAADEFSTSAKPRFVAGSMGPTTKAMTVTGGITFEDLKRDYFNQAKALVEGGADLLLLETCQDTRNVKAGLLGMQLVFEELGRKVPIMVSGTIEPMGTMLVGQPADAFVASLAHIDLLSVGLNCATGPEFMTDHLRTMHQMARCGVSCYPNAGLPDEDGQYLETPDSLASALERFAKNGWLNLIGGCCGTTPGHIRAIAQMVEGKQPRRHRGALRTYYSGIELVEASDDNRPLLVGERTNEVGSRAFKRLISNERYEEASEIGRRQVKNGAQVIDINLENPDRDELEDIDRFYEKIIHKVKAPLMIDSTNSRAVERALTYCLGKSIINSVNFEDGEERFNQVLPLVKKYGAAIIIGSIDEDKLQAQAVTRERKLAIAQRAHKLCTETWGIPAEDLIFDPLVFPCATGDENYIGSAVETIESVRLIKQALPQCKTVLGVSNVSFGLPDAAREVVNSVFLYHATKAGLDLAIVNTEKLERYAAIPEDEKKLADDLLKNAPLEGSDVPEDYRQQSPKQRAEINQHHIAKITEHFRGSKGRVKKVTADLPLDERLANYIIEGTKEGLVADLEIKRLEGTAPLDIINGPLMDGMKEVGRLFNNNELIVAEVLQSAEAMKASVNHLEQYMERIDTAAKGKVVLATVKGDVHDIGKNLVDIILTNNGYEVVNLGIKVPPEDLIKAYREQKPDVIGLSGLLVKSAQQMVITVGDLREAGVSAPILVGGAALSDSFTRRKIAPAYGSPVCYSKDAMTGLSLMNRLMDETERQAVYAEHAPREDDRPALRQEVPVISLRRSSRARTDLPALPAPYRERMKREIPQLDEVWSYLNPQMLYSRHLGLQGSFEKKLAERDPKALELRAVIEQVKDEARGLMKVRAVWQFFDAESEGNTIRLFPGAGGTASREFSFPRQRRDDGLSLADFVIPTSNGTRDSIAAFVVGAGEGIRERSEEYKQRGEYLKSHAIQALAIETAEATAEWVHRRIREDWGFADPAEMTMRDRFKSKYRGRRYSFGYAACPNLEDQEVLFELLRPEEIGVHLTEGCMMEPEASVSAIVFQHPDCIYFDVNS